MARKSGVKTPYTSKGQRPNVARTTINAMRRDRRLNPSIASIFQRAEYRSMVLSRPKDRKLANLHKKYVEQEQIKSRAEGLYKQFIGAGVTWAACVQAVKTDYIGQLEMKYGRITAKVKEKLKESGK